MKSTYCEYILEKILSTSEVGPILALIAPSPLHRHFKYVKKLSNEKFLDIRELDENYLTYYKIPIYIECIEC